MKVRWCSGITGLALGFLLWMAGLNIIAILFPSVRPNNASEAQNSIGGYGRSRHEFKSLNPSPYVNVIKDLGVVECNSVNLANLQPAVKICIHNVTEDVWVSKAIAKGGFFEGGHVQAFRMILKSHPELQVIDIGANIGQYSLVGAYMGRQVMAVEARKLHVHMVYRSMQLNGWLDRLTLVHNAISDTHTRVELGTQADNQGGTHVLENQNTTNGMAKSIKDDLSVTTILMDDLATVVPFSQAFLKMDIEGFEDRAFRHAQKLFKQVFIPFVMVEWDFMKKKPAEIVEPVIAWLRSEGYEPYRLKQEALILKAYSDWRDWGFDVVFKHRTASL